MAMRWLYDIPDWVMAVLAVGAAIGLSVGGFFATRPLRVRASNEVAGPVLATVGLVQGVLLALVAVAAWSNYTEAGDAAEREATAVVNMFRKFEGYQEPARQRFEARLRTYVDLLITDEWPALQHGAVSARTIQASDALAREWVTFEPRGDREQLLYTAIGRELEELLDARRSRLAAGRAGLPGPLWAVALLGAAVTVVCTYFFRMEHERTQLIITSTVAASLGLLIYLILVLDHPLWGSQGIRPDVLVDASHSIGAR